jgi:hypothetical protein
MANSTYPQIREFQSAHRKLLREYISAIDVASSLPFFVNLTRLLRPHEKESAFIRLNRQSWFLFTPLTWKPFVRFLLETHVKAKMGELSIAYNQLALRLPEGKKFDSFRTALKSAVAECNQLSDTLKTWKNGRTLMAGVVPVLAGWLTSWLGTDNLLAALPRLGIEIKGTLLSGSFASFLQIMVWIVTSGALLFILLNQAFEGKRAIFLPAWLLDRSEVTTHNIYASEDALYKLMGLHKTPEFALDAIALVVFFLFVIAFFVLRSYYYSSSLLFINLLAVPVLIFFIVWAIRRSNQRWN